VARLRPPFKGGKQTPQKIFPLEVSHQYGIMFKIKRGDSHAKANLFVSSSPSCLRPEKDQRSHTEPLAKCRTSSPKTSHVSPSNLILLLENRGKNLQLDILAEKSYLELDTLRPALSKTRFSTPTYIT
jgi:hypothetical protein